MEHQIHTQPLQASPLCKTSLTLNRAASSTSRSSLSTSTLTTSTSSSPGNSRLSNWLCTSTSPAKCPFRSLALFRSTSSGARRRMNRIRKLGLCSDPSRKMSRYCRFSALHVMTRCRVVSPGGCALSWSRRASSQPRRSASVRGSPRCIFSTLARGWNWNLERKGGERFSRAKRCVYLFFLGGGGERLLYSRRHLPERTG